jgi:hypothetical protein
MVGAFVEKVRYPEREASPFVNLVIRKILMPRGESCRLYN